MARIPQLTLHSVAADHNCSLRFCCGVFLAVAWLASSAAQAQTTNYALGTTGLLVGPAAATNSVVLGVTPQTGTWTAAANAAWLHLSPANQGGTGSTNVLFSYDANSGVTRSGTLTIGDQTLTVTQAGSTYVAAGSRTSLSPSVSASGVAVDIVGNVYITVGGTVQKWTATNNTVTILFSLGASYGVAVDGVGNVYIADNYNSAIKKWTAANSNVTTLVSSGLQSPRGVAVDGGGNVYIADTGNNTIKEWTAANSNVTTLVSSGLNAPYGVAVDGAGNVYISDTGNNAIKEWTAANSNVTTLVSSGLNAPYGVAVDGAGDVYFADSNNLEIKEWTAANGNVSTLVLSGANEGVAVDGAGNVYFVGTGLEELPHVFVDPTWRSESDAGGSDTLPIVLPATANLLPPFAPTRDQSWLTISGISNGVVSLSFTANLGPNRAANITLFNQTIPVTQGGGVYALGTTALLVGPAAGSNTVVLGVTPQNVLWTATANANWLHLNAANQSGTGSTNVVFSYDANSGATRSGTLTVGDQTLTVTQAGSTYAAVGALTTLVSSGLNSSSGLAVDGAGNVYIADSYNNLIKEWTVANNTVTTLVSSGLTHPAGVAVDRAGNVYIADSTSGKIIKWTVANSKLTTLVSSVYPGAVAVDGTGNVYISSNYGSIDEWSVVNNTFKTLLGGGNGVAVDAAGNVYGGANPKMVQKWTAANDTVTTLVSSGLGYAAGLAVDGAGNVFIADNQYSTIKKWTAASNTVTTLVSSGVPFPSDVAVDGAGNVYIDDGGAIKELPHAFVDPTPRLEPLIAGSDTLPVVLPATANLLPPFAPTTDQPWLTISGITNGVVSFSFSANTGSARTAHITLLGRTIPITQGVVGTTPALTGLQMLGNGVLQFAFTNNPGAAFTVISTTNPSLPLSDWTVVGTPSNTAPGMFQFTSQPTTNQPQLFYSVRSPY